MTEGFGTGVQLTRTQTIMQGASHCDFRYVLKQSEKTPDDGRYTSREVVVQLVFAADERKRKA